MLSVTKYRKKIHRNIVVPIRTNVTKLNVAPKSIKPVKLNRRKLVHSKGQIVDVSKGLDVGGNQIKPVLPETEELAEVKPIIKEPATPEIIRTRQRKRKRDHFVEIDLLHIRKRPRLEVLTFFDLVRTERKRKHDDYNPDISLILHPSKKPRLDTETCFQSAGQKRKQDENIVDVTVTSPSKKRRLDFH